MLLRYFLPFSQTESFTSVCPSTESSLRPNRLRTPIWTTFGFVGSSFRSSRICFGFWQTRAVEFQVADMCGSTRLADADNKLVGFGHLSVERCYTVFGKLHCTRAGSGWDCLGRSWCDCLANYSFIQGSTAHLNSTSGIAMSTSPTPCKMNIECSEGCAAD